MKGMKVKNLLRLTTVLVLLAVLLTGCFGGEDPEETKNELPGLESTEGTNPIPTDEVTEAPTTAPETEPPVITVMGTVDTDLLNVRTGPSTGAAIAGQLTKGARVEILEQTTIDNVDWARTEVGWVCMDYILVDGAEETPSEEPAEPTEPPKSDPADGSGAKGTITADALYIRKGPGTSYEAIGKYTKGDTVYILETKNNWGRTDKGWISLKHVKMAGTSTSNNNTGTENKTEEKLISDGKTTVLGYGVTRTDLNIRYGPGTKHGVVDTVRGGTRVAYYQKSGNWIRIKDGWVSLSYVYVEGNKGENGCSGTITGDDLNIRKGPGTSYDSVGKLNKGDKVTILETIKVGKTAWGYTGSGWISMDYVEKT